MLVPLNFIDKNIVKPVFQIDDQMNVMKKFRLKRNDIINLCGGIPSDKITTMKVNASSNYKDTLHVRIVTNLYEVSRTLNFDTLHITNHAMIVYHGKQKIGTHLFLNQVNAARQKQFRRLDIVAQAPNKYEHDWMGYYCWGRMGYTMKREDQKMFESWAAGHNVETKILYELLRSPEGQALWKLEGFDWLGEFWLQDQSVNLAYLKEYLKEKQLVLTFLL